MAQRRWLQTGCESCIFKCASFCSPPEVMFIRRWVLGAHAFHGMNLHQSRQQMRLSRVGCRAQVLVGIVECAYGETMRGSLMETLLETPLERQVGNPV